MEFIVSSNELLKGLLDVSKAIPAKTALPILENFLLVLKDGRLEITASDQELTLRTALEVESSVSDGSIAIPARQMMDLLKALPDRPVSIKTTSDGTFACDWTNGNSSLPYFPAADYPEIKGVGDEATTASFPSKVLAEGISSTIYATADDEIRRYGHRQRHPRGHRFAQAHLLHHQGSQGQREVLLHSAQEACGSAQVRARQG